MLSDQLEVCNAFWQVLVKLKDRRALLVNEKRLYTGIEDNIVELLVNEKRLYTGIEDNIVELF